MVRCRWQLSEPSIVRQSPEAAPEAEDAGGGADTSQARALAPGSGTRSMPPIHYPSQRVICTVPLTLTVTLPLPGSIGSDSSLPTDADIARICIGTPRGIGSLALTLTSRIT